MLNTSKITKLALTASATAAAIIALPAIAHAGPDYWFQSPSGDIGCHLLTLSGGKAGVVCQIRDYTYPVPPRPTGCPGSWGDEFGVVQSEAPKLGCHLDTVFNRGLQTLNYGDSLSAQPITCDSEPSGMTCTDSSTGHFFRVSRDSYQLG
ncbi:DUF6636 domain-containing protein [Mycobacterium heidelbergense]|uniref:DUF6636 domain-containing protein n=1 Tax=Mycobacterium heidelbergense TaxID=53376 RepID=UPI003CE7CB52